MQKIAVFGAGGAIGRAVIHRLGQQFPDADIHAFSRYKVSDLHYGTAHQLDYLDEAQLGEAAAHITREGALNMVFVATGILHDGIVQPEKSLKELSAQNFQHVFEANTIVPALIGKYFAPRLCRDQRAIFAAISARVGSISDNHLGGWYAYRTSKAALNMVIKNAAIELARTHPHAIVVSMHPGTVDSGLSKPFQAHVPQNKLFTPAYSAQKLVQVLQGLTVQHTGRCFAWDGQEIAP